MSSLFSAYARSSPVLDRAALKLAALASMAWAVWSAIDGEFSRGSAPAFLLTGGLVLAVAIIHGLMRSSRLTLGLATLGATLVVVGLITASIAPSYGCESDPASGDGFEVICL